MGRLIINKPKNEKIVYINKPKNGKTAYINKPKKWEDCLY